MRTIRNWVADLAFGVRLSVGGGRTPWGRLTLTAVGIGLGVAVLLLASSVQQLDGERRARQEARGGQVYVQDPAEAAGAAVLVAERMDEFRGQPVLGVVVDPQRPGAPHPPGIAGNPAPGEVLVSPALKALLDGPDGELLRPRLPGAVTGVVGQEALASPGELFYFVGSDRLLQERSSVAVVRDHFGESSRQDRGLDSEQWMILSLGVSALLVPVVVFVASTARLAESARERRLAALRLVGSSGRQVRRIAAGEALAGALAGVVLGWGIFLLGRLVAGAVEVLGFTVYSSDIWPMWWYAIAVTVGVPVIAVATAITAMRGTIVEPLSVVRRTPAGRRRLLWRLVPIVLGTALILAVREGAGGVRELMFVTAVVLILVGVPLVLAWVFERVMGRLRGSSLPGQLAVRGLQLSSGSAARSVSAIAVVLTGVISLQTVVASMEATYTAQRRTPADPSALSVHGTQARDIPVDPAGATAQALSEVPGITGVEPASYSSLTQGEEPQAPYHLVVIADCAVLARKAAVGPCQDGDAFYSGGVDRTPAPAAGTRMHVEPSFIGERATAWTTPAGVRQIGPIADESDSARFLLTPKAAEGIPVSARSVNIDLRLGPDVSPDTIEHVRNVAATHLVGSSVTRVEGTEGVQPSAFNLIRYGLLLGALVTFALIGCSLFVSAAEQIQQRRRQMAVLAAVGVRRRTLAWSALLQNALPMLAAVVVALGIGALLGGLVLLVLEPDRVAFDLPGLAGLLGIAAAAVAVVTALTLPALGRAMHPEGLRTE
ncbi:FtsX-like permease family protein [Saccharopolyspora erythraea]|uniref:ABC transporter permease n=1 Tax=Saccharopolyspora erythraea TaxID=1836 RepID=UPI001BAC4E59|nr:FtsX-like permease family protein [Saccharopolyspora erythraea]QUH02971.1 FtsX-like permease family protein [Saccharopolyspora erythraea]